MSQWWGERRVEVGTTTRWQIGPLILWIQRLPGEWRVYRTRLEDPLDGTVELEERASGEAIPAAASIERFAFQGDSPLLELAARLPDRPIVSRPRNPFHVPPGEDLVFFVDSPLWVGLSTMNPRRWLFEMPVFRPSDTWFGPSTNEGELCYASRTAGTLQLSDTPIRPHRCLTAVTIRNRASDELLLDRLKLPVASLALYVGEDRRIWTQDVSLERHERGDRAQLSIRRSEPALALDPRPLSPARKAESDNVVARVFNTLFT